MEKEDFDYFLTSIANISAIPIRLYKNNKIIEIYSIINFDIDPVKLYESNLLEVNEKIYCFNASHFFYYGLITVSNYKIIIGPTASFINEDCIRSLAYDLNLPLDMYPKFKQNILMTTSMPFTTFFLMLLLINYVLNNEKRYMDEFIDKKTTEKFNEEFETTHHQDYHINSMQVEKEILKIVRNGDLDALEVFTKNIKTVRSGNIGNTPLRNAKNLFVVTTTLISREAIKAGVNEEDALSTSDALINRVELLNTNEEINNLNFECIYTYTKMVSLYKDNKNSILASKITRYILQNLSKSITLDELSNYFFISKSNLCTKFKKEVGISINQFILNKKIQISLELLKDKSKSIAYISEYLGFSSPPHFTKVFKSIKNMTPNQFRNINDD